ncbi:HTH_Tnp_Tc3_2 domain-containing protein [Trichonephila clavipes]|nr:HTH_Tnp_Tc3_2 domain-containing protein [Trichonephila clavipes]
MPRVRSRNAYQHASDFDKGRIVACGDCGLSHCSFATGVDRDSMIVCRILNVRVQDGNAERRAGSQGPPITSSREDRHVSRMTLMGRAASS